jgi:hypothetical protein
MSIKGDIIAVGVAAAVVFVAAWVIKNKLAGMVPDVVKEGAEAAAQLGGLAWHAVSSPLDAFGVRPGADAYGSANWTPTVPWENPDDVVSNGAGGINWNLF